MHVGSLLQTVTFEQHSEKNEGKLPSLSSFQPVTSSRAGRLSGAAFAKWTERTIVCVIVLTDLDKEGNGWFERRRRTLPDTTLRPDYAHLVEPLFN